MKALLSIPQTALDPRTASGKRSTDRVSILKVLSETSEPEIDFLSSRKLHSLQAVAVPRMEGEKEKKLNAIKQYT